MANPPGYMGLNQSGRPDSRKRSRFALPQLQTQQRLPLPQHSPHPPTHPPPSVPRLDCERGGDGEEELSQLFILPLSPFAPGPERRVACERA